MQAKIFFQAFPGFSRLSMKIPGFSRPGKAKGKIPDFSRFSRLRTNPVYMYLYFAGVGLHSVEGNKFPFVVKTLIHKFWEKLYLKVNMQKNTHVHILTSLSVSLNVLTQSRSDFTPVTPCSDFTPVTPCSDFTPVTPCHQSLTQVSVGPGQWGTTTTPPAPTPSPWATSHHAICVIAFLALLFFNHCGWPISNWWRYRSITFGNKEYLQSL